MLHDIVSAYPKNGKIKYILQEHADGLRDIRQIDDIEHTLDVTRKHFLIAADEIVLDTGRFDRTNARDRLNEKGSVFTADKEPLVDHALENRRNHKVQQDKERQDQHDHQAQYLTVQEHDGQINNRKDNIQNDGKR